MSVLVLGLNYRTAPIGLLERAAIATEELPKALASLVRRSHVTEAVVLSTCNRVEAYAHVTRYHGGVADLRNFFSEWAGVAPEDFTDLAYDYHDDRAAAHLFAVTCGIDSMVIGERQIQLQVKEAFARAEAEGTAGRTLHSLFRRALRVGKRARAETGIASGGASMVDVGLEAAAHVLGDLDGRTALLVGAGKMGGMAASRFAGRGPILVANRGSDKRERLARRVGATTLDLSELVTGLREADFVVCSTGAPDQVVTADLVAEAMRARPERPLALVDLAVPRDVDPACRKIPGVTVLDVLAIRGITDRGEAGAEVAAARRLVEEEVERFAAWARGNAAGPTIAALRTRAEVVRQAELRRLSARLASLDERERAAVDALTKGIVNTLLHEPSVRLKQLADSRGEEHYADALRELFDLPPGEE